MIPFLLSSPWPAPVPNGEGRALDFHLGAFGRWLTTAGAEPRLALVLCSGRAARDRFVEGIGFDRIEGVHAPATPARPVHPAVLAHHGDHFNRTLFVVDGFEDAGDREALFAGLEGRVGTLDQSATWVAVVVESLEALGALYAHAPSLARRAKRRLLVLDAHAADSKAAPLSADLRARWRRDGRIAEQVFHHAMTPAHAPDALDFDRLARTGYAPAFVGRAMHPERQRLAALWHAGPGAGSLPFAADQAGPVAARAALGHAALDAPTREALAKRIEAPIDRFVAGLPVADAPILAQLRHVAAMGEGEATPAPGALARLRGLVAEAEPAVRAHAHAAIAAAAAALEDVERCEAALAACADAAAEAGLPELLFDALEKQTRLHALLDRPSKARGTFGALDALAPELHAPLYAGRRLLARGELSAPLDPARAAVDLAEAERLFTAHGWPDRAATAREVLP